MQLLAVLLNRKILQHSNVWLQRNNVPDAQLLIIFCSLIKRFLQCYYHQIWACLGRKICHHNLDFIDAIDILKLRLPSPTSDTKLIFLIFFQNKKIFLVSFPHSPVILHHISNYLHMFVHLVEAPKVINVRPTRFLEFHTNWNNTKQLPMLDVSFAILLVILANKY